MDSSPLDAYARALLAFEAHVAEAARRGDGAEEDAEALLAEDAAEPAVQELLRAMLDGRRASLSATLTSSATPPAGAGE